MAPDRNNPLGEVLKHFRKRIYRGPKDAELEAKRVWKRTGFPEGSEVEVGCNAI